jgi:hypothetical protein
MRWLRQQIPNRMYINHRYVLPSVRMHVCRCRGSNRADLGAMWARSIRIYINATSISLYQSRQYIMLISRLSDQAAQMHLAIRQAF